jgi:type I restriction enzyme R subunit
VATFEKGLVDLIVERGAGAIDTLPGRIKGNPSAVAETIINNVRKTIVDEHAQNPKYYDKMSALLNALIEQRRQDAVDYKKYLDELLSLANRVGTKQSDVVYPEWVKNGAQQALVDFGFDDADLAKMVDSVVVREKRHDWVGNRLKEREVANALRKVVGNDFERFDELFDLVRARDEYR